jgi:hypothetical protein
MGEGAQSRRNCSTGHVSAVEFSTVCCAQLCEKKLFGLQLRSEWRFPCGSVGMTLAERKTAVQVGHD